MNKNIFNRPLIPLLIAFISGILLGSEFPGFEIWVGAIVIGCVGSCIFSFYRLKSILLTPFFLFIALGHLCMQPWVSPRFSANHISYYADTHRWDIIGRIATRPRQNNNRIRFDLHATSLSSAHQSLAVTGKLGVTVVGELPDLAAGDTILFNSYIRTTSNFRNPGGFDYKRYLAFKGIWATAYVKGNRLVVIERQPPGSPLGILNHVRNSFAELVAKSGHSQAQGVLKALIIGDRSQITEDTRQMFQRAGVGHLLAISGLHIGIVASVAFILFHWLMLRIKPFLWRAWTRKGAATLSLLSVLAYGMIAGLSPSTQRAVIMVSIFLMTFLFEREQDSFNTLALAALVILIADPPSLFSISFQLSFTAVFAILFGLSRLQNRAPTPKPEVKNIWHMNFFKRLVSFFWVSFLAICGTLPLVAFYFNQISFVGLVANFLVVPLVGSISIPLGLAALFVSALSKTLASWCITAAIATLDIGLDIVEYIADMPLAAAKTITPSLLEIGCFYILSWALLDIGGGKLMRAGKLRCNIEIKANDDPSNHGVSPSGFSSGLGNVHRNKQHSLLKGFAQLVTAKMVVLLVLVTLAADTCFWLYQRFWRADLRVTVIDVGHGCASLLELPRGYTILIDGGGFSDNSAFDVGAKIIAPYLWRKKIRTVDTLILSHPNSDHLNGLIYIAEHFNVKSVWTNNETRDTLGYLDFMEVIANRKIFLPVYAKMTRTHCINGVNLDLLYPPQDFTDNQDMEKWHNSNNNSLVVKASFGSTSILFPGDIMAPAEKELVRIAGGKLASMVLIAPHHGSRSSSSEVFLGAVNPEVVIISSGRNRRSKFPHPAVLSRYENHGYNIFRTDINGAVCLTTDGRHMSIKPWVAF